MRSLVVVALLACAAGVLGDPLVAVVRMFGTTFAPTANGLIRIEDKGDGRYNLSFSGFPANAFEPNSVHGIHIHQFGDQSSPTAANAGGHYNPYNKPHGCPGGDERHVGDLGNITVDAAGTPNNQWIIRAGFNFTFDAAATDVNNNVVGRMVIIHQLFDDCITINTGNASNRFAQGTIGIAMSAPSYVGSPFNAAALSARIVDNTGAPLGWAWLRPDATNSSLAEIFVRAGGLVPGSIHGIHIHQWGDHTDLFANTAGGHWSPQAYPHRLPYEGGDHHMGDLGNVIADANGNIFHHTSVQWVVIGGPNMDNVIGRGFVLHAQPDQGTAVAVNGGAGSRLGMGVLGIADPTKFPTPGSSAVLSAYVKLLPAVGSNPGASGSVRFTHGDDNLVKIDVAITGMTPGAIVAMHIHEFGDVSSLDGQATGGHYNPYGFAHGCYPNKAQRHTGDIGNLTAAAGDGSITATLYRDWISLVGANSTIGRAVIVHAAFDDCFTPNTGNAGARLLQGVLGIAQAPAQNASNLGIHPSRPITGLIAALQPTTAVSGTSASGWAWFRTSPDDATRTQIFVNLTGVLPVSARHGIHVHTYGDWTNSNGATAGSHYNPGGYAHYLPGQSDLRHMGDLGNVNVDANGNVLQTLEVGNMPIRDIIGRGIVLHENPDGGNNANPDTGDSGNRLALGVIGISTKPWPSNAPAVVPVSSSSTGICLTADGSPCNAASSTAPSLAVALVSLAAALLVALRLN